MALTGFQRDVCRVLAEQRRRGGESYVAGGGALNELLAAPRRSHDLDLFHDTAAALAGTWARDREALRAAGYQVVPERELPGFVVARVALGGDSVLVEWAQDSAYRFFPLIEHELLGLTLHPFDLATNKLLAIAGRREARDWVDGLTCNSQVQPLGYLAWAAAGKDPGYTPSDLVERCAATRYAQAELDALDFDEPRPAAATLSRSWHQAVEDARALVVALPGEQAGTCVLDLAGSLLRVGPDELRTELAAGKVRFHAGRIQGAFPELRR
ncbi:MAG: hypothetical protein QM767_21135 [Anaeromyxobacter sp.]